MSASPVARAPIRPPLLDGGNLTVIGTQWGDEGKGKIVDWLSADFDIVVRFQGGNNAGHTVVIGDKQYILSLLPSAVTRKGKTAIIGSGMVVDPEAFLGEVARLRNEGLSIDRNNLVVAESAALLLAVHRRLDELEDKQTIGTTGRGIGPAYQDKTGRRAVRVADLRHRDKFAELANNLADYHGPRFVAAKKPPPVAQSMVEELQRAAEILLPFVGSDRQILSRAAKEGKKTLFEGAQGAMLDVAFGTYPFVTSSHTMPAYAALGSGAPMATMGGVLGVTKAYATRVGNGCFPTELKGQIGRKIGVAGAEVGAVTGRKRRCGWLDLVMLRQVVKSGGIDALALTKLDVLDGFASLQLAVAYRLEGKRIDHLPASRFCQERLEPIYEEVGGWKTATAEITDYHSLPSAAKDYIRRIEEFCEVKVSIVSVGPKREQTFRSP